MPQIGSVWQYIPTPTVYVLVLMNPGKLVLCVYNDGTLGSFMIDEWHEKFLHSATLEEVLLFASQ